MTSSISAVLDLYCKTEYEKHCLLQILFAKKQVDELFLRELNQGLMQFSRCRSLSTWHSIARCNEICMRGAEYPNDWNRIVIAELQAICDQPEIIIDAYSMGSMIGLFRANAYVRDTRKVSQGRPPFLQQMIPICIGMLGKKYGFVNQDEGTNPEGELGRAIKAYMRPGDPEIAQRLGEWEIRPTLAQLRRQLEGLIGTVGYNFVDRVDGPGKWILNSIIHGALDLENRGTLELLTATTSVNPVLP